ncbi:MAG: lipopolysaccharide transport system permease protein, partial [Alphaproteobacteria bacterium]
MTAQDQPLRTVQVGRQTFFGYLAAIWQYRDMALHLANADLQSRFRRSALGIIWAMVHPLAFTMLYAFVLANLFKQEFVVFSIYVFSGFILWDAIASFVNLGAVSIVSGAGYLKQSPMPMLIFPLRTSLTVMVIFLIGLGSFTIYRAGIYGLHALGYIESELPLGPIATIYWAWIPLVALALVAMGSAWATIVGFLNLKFRDAQQMLLIIMQALWFASPVFFAREIFDSPNLAFWTAINPVLAFCDAFREPVLYARSPDAHTWMVIGGWIVASWIGAII